MSVLYPKVRRVSSDSGFHPAYDAKGTAVLGAFGLVAFLLSLCAYQGARAVLVPDTASYAQGGLGLFPSPIGRALGYFGTDVLAVWSSIGCGVCVCLVIIMGRRLGSSGIAGGVLALLLPMGWWMFFTGVDSLGAGLMLGGFLASHRSGWWFGLAGLTHSALIPLTLVRLWKYSPLIILGGILMLILTPYSLEVDPASLAGGLINALIIVAFVCLPFLILGRVGLWVAPPGLAIVALAVSLSVGAMRQGIPSLELWTATRYGLPLFLLCCAGVRWRSKWQ